MPIIFAVIDVAGGEYGHDYIDKMISMVDNGRCYQWTPYDLVVENNQRNQKCLTYPHMADFEEEIDEELLRPRSTNWQQFCTLYKRRTKQMWRDSVRTFLNLSSLT